MNRLLDSAPASDSGCESQLRYLDRGEAPVFEGKKRKHGFAPNKRIEPGFSHDREGEDLAEG